MKDLFEVIEKVVVGIVASMNVGAVGFCLYKIIPAIF